MEARWNDLCAVLSTPRLACVGALLLIGCSTIERREDVAMFVGRVSEAELRRHVQALAVKIGPRPPHEDATSEAAVAYLLDELRALGYDVREERYEASYGEIERFVAADGSPTVRFLRVRDVLRSNVIAELRGAEEPESAVEISAHYDTVYFSPGADDDASGVAGVLEAARVLRDARCRRTIRFVVFGSEEYDFAGSRAHLANLSRAERESFLGLINLDPIGFASSEPGSQVELVPWWAPFPGVGDVGDFVLVAGNARSAALGNRFEDVIDVYVPDLPYYSANRIAGWFADASRSDHARYWEARLPAIFITDTGEFRNPTYHRAGDLPDTLDYPFLRRVVQAAVATVLHVAEPLLPHPATPPPTASSRSRS